MSRARRLHLIRNRWYRYLWLSMRSSARFLADMPARGDVSVGRLRVAMMRSIDQEWSYLFEA